MGGSRIVRLKTEYKFRRLRGGGGGDIPIMYHGDTKVRNHASWSQVMKTITDGRKVPSTVGIFTKLSTESQL